MNNAILLVIILLLGGCSTGRQDRAGAGKNWNVYLGDKFSSHYSNLDQINRDNVHNLVPAWEYHSGDDISGNNSQIQCNPLIIEGVLYGTSPGLILFALDAATGTRLWEFDPDPNNDYSLNVNRGVAFWQNGNDRRILFSSGAELFAINAGTGLPVMEFGDSGRISLREGLGDNVRDKYIAATTPGVVYRDLLIIGSRVSEEAGAAPGYIRAFNIRDGHLTWTFRTIPLPGDFGYDTWPPDAYKTAGGANSWAGMSLDEEKGIVYIPTGSAAFDFWGGNRKGENLFANCILALDAATGERKWHFQTVHHDIWDRDLPAPPNLFTFTRNGRKTDALAQITKSGFVFILDRETGVPLFPVTERPVQKSDMPGEETWPTQPFPELPPPFSPQSFTADKVNDIDSATHSYVSSILNRTRTGEQFIPPSFQGTVVFPGFDGGGEWGGAAVDPNTSIMYVNGSIMPWILTMVKVKPDSLKKIGLGMRAYRVNCAVCHGIDPAGKPNGNFPSLANVTDKLSENQIIAIINTGKGFMPSFRHLGSQEKKAIFSFLSGKETGDAVVDAADNAVPYTFTGYNRFVDKNGYPAIKPPWGTISAIDLSEGSIKWQVPLGGYSELANKGFPDTGTENYGGPAVTAGGLLFIGASKDEYFRAFDISDGKELWKFKLKAGGYATPAVYSVNGKQYVVIACGGGKMGTRSGDSYMAFTLADK